MTKKAMKVKAFLMALVLALVIVSGASFVKHFHLIETALAKSNGNVTVFPTAVWCLMPETPNPLVTNPEVLPDILNDATLAATLAKQQAVLWTREWLRNNSHEQTVNRLFLSNRIEAQYAERDAAMDQELSALFAELEAAWKAEREYQEREEALRKNAEEKGLVYRRNPAFCMDLTDEEYRCLLKIVQAEAPNEPMEGKILVANVVLNRVLSGDFPNSVISVVFQEKQFSPIRDGAYKRANPTAETKEAVRRALEGEDYSEGAMYFFARRWTSKENARWFDTCLTKVAQFGCHEFYK